MYNIKSVDMYNIKSVCSVFSDAGRDKTQLEKWRSILAQLEYKHQIGLWHSKGILFKDHLYVPEVHPISFVNERMKLTS